MKIIKLLPDGSFKAVDASFSSSSINIARKYRFDLDKNILIESYNLKGELESTVRVVDKDGSKYKYLITPEGDKLFEII